MSKTCLKQLLSLFLVEQLIYLILHLVDNFGVRKLICHQNVEFSKHKKTRQTKLCTYVQLTVHIYMLFNVLISC